MVSIEIPIQVYVRYCRKRGDSHVYIVETHDVVADWVLLAVCVTLGGEKIAMSKCWVDGDSSPP